LTFPYCLYFEYSLELFIMSDLENRIAQFQKMANDDPDNELGHYRLGQLYMENKQFEEAVASFNRTLILSPQFSKVFQLLGNSLLSLDKKSEAVTTLQKGFTIADERGDNMPRDEMARMLKELGEPVPESKKTAAPINTGAGDAMGNMQCTRPGCMVGSKARKLPAPPLNDELGKRIFEAICADCWSEWVKNYSIKVINELRLDLSSERGQAEYDKYMHEFLGLTQE
jgi:Fe-S cluster biosynthesis and repair protein YggX